MTWRWTVLRESERGEWISAGQSYRTQTHNAVAGPGLLHVEVGPELELELGGAELLELNPEPMCEPELLEDVELLDRALELLDRALELLDRLERLELEPELLLLELKVELLGELELIWLLELGPLWATRRLPSVCADDEDDGGY